MIYKMEYIGHGDTWSVTPIDRVNDFKTYTCTHKGEALRLLNLLNQVNDLEVALLDVWKRAKAACGGDDAVTYLAEIIMARVNEELKLTNGGGDGA